MSIKLFISHSTWRKPDLNERLQAQVEAHSEFRELLCRRLREVIAPKIEVIIDQDIPVGRPWRDFLFGAIAECNAAIVLLNEQALHYSPWVDAELTVLGFRAYKEPDDFRLFVVPVGGVKAADLAKKTVWRPIDIDGLQVVPRGGPDETDPRAVEDLIQKVIGALSELREVRSEGSSCWLVSRLCNLLPSDLNVLKEIAERLNLRLAQSTNSFVLRRLSHTFFITTVLHLLWSY
jgi:TIR domain